MLRAVLLLCLTGGVAIAYSGARRTAFRGEAEQDSGLIANSIPGARRTRIPG
jgi:hypothetical protein